jgi:hypothetical protein
LLSLTVASMPGVKGQAFLPAADKGASSDTPQLVRRHESRERGRTRPGMAKKLPPFYLPFLLVLSLNVLVISGALAFYALVSLR